MTHPSSRFNWPPVLTGEILLFNILGKLLHEYPDRDWILSLSKDGVFDEVPFGSQQPHIETGLKLLQDWAEQCQGDNADKIFDDVRSDYTHLFIGPGTVQVPPWESVYLMESRLIFQESTLQVRSWYDRFGLESRKLYKEPDDHIGLELVFMAHLAHLALSALDNKDGAGFQNALDAQRDFAAEHLFQWAPTFCDLVYENAKTDFYRGIALLLSGAFKELEQIFELDVSR